MLYALSLPKSPRKDSWVYASAGPPNHQKCSLQDSLFLSYSHDTLIIIIYKFKLDSYWVSIMVLSDNFFWWWRYSTPALFRSVATGHRWLLSTWNMASAIEEQNFWMYLILINFNLDRHMQLVATVLCSKAP